MNERHIAIMKVDRDVLRAALHLPEGTRILEVTTTGNSDSIMRDQVMFKIDHPDLPAVKEGHWMNTVSPQVKVTTISYDITEFDRWS